MLPIDAAKELIRRYDPAFVYCEYCPNCFKKQAKTKGSRSLLLSIPYNGKGSIFTTLCGDCIDVELNQDTLVINLLKMLEVMEIKEEI